MPSRTYLSLFLVALFIGVGFSNGTVKAVPKGIRYKRPKPTRTTEPIPAITTQQTKARGPLKTVAVWPKYQPDFRFPGVDELVIDELVNSNQFIVVERLNIQALEMEANMFENVRHIGAQLIFEITVTDVDQRSSRGLQIGLGELGLGDHVDVVLGTSRTTANANVILRVIDTSTGQIISSQRSQGISSGSGVNLGFAYDRFHRNHINGFGVSFGKIKTSSVGKAVAKAVKLAVVKTTTRLNDHPWEARVADFDDQLVYLNAGTNAGLGVGNQLVVSRVSKTITDPQTGAVLDVVMVPVCDLTVVRVKEKIAVCRITLRASTAALLEKNQVVHFKQ